MDGYEILNDDVEWREDTVPRIQITLTANDDYYFQSLPKDKVTIKGGAEFKNSKREDSSTTLLMDVELQALNTSLHDLTNVVLTEDGIATWDAIPAAGSYEARVQGRQGSGRCHDSQHQYMQLPRAHAEGQYGIHGQGKACKQI